MSSCLLSINIMCDDNIFELEFEKCLEMLSVVEGSQIQTAIHWISHYTHNSDSFCDALVRHRVHQKLFELSQRSEFKHDIGDILIHMTSSGKEYRELLVESGISLVFSAYLADSDEEIRLKGLVGIQNIIPMMALCQSAIFEHEVLQLILNDAWLEYSTTTQISHCSLLNLLLKKDPRPNTQLKMSYLLFFHIYINSDNLLLCRNGA